MNDNFDKHWQQLVALSAPTFAGATVPPYGFTTNMLAKLREESRAVELVERIGLRAVFAALGMLAIALGVLVSANYFSGSDLEPGLKSMLQVENVAVSN
jgi:hypothetical protein